MSTLAYSTKAFTTEKSYIAAATVCFVLISVSAADDEAAAAKPLPVARPLLAVVWP